MRETVTSIKKAAHIVIFLSFVLLFSTGVWAENKKFDFETSVCFKCHQTTDFKPSEKTEQQWRMLIEKNQHEIFKKIVWEYPDQKKQILDYLVKHAGGSGAEGIGVWH
jgi:hypothetical protein